MSKKKKPRMEYRYYEIPPGSFVLALLGQKWIQNYGSRPDSLHFHNHLEIGYCHYGKGHMVLEGEEIPYEGGMFTVIPKNFPHTTASEPGSVDCWEYLFIDADGLIRQMYKESSYIADRLLQKVNQGGCLVRETDHPELGTLIRQIIEEMSGQRELYTETVKGLAYALLIQIARVSRGKGRIVPEELPEEHSAAISPALEYISQNYAGQLKIEQLAQCCHMSETHFRRIFRKSMRLSPVEYINWTRVRAACEELRRTNDPVGVIAARTGFVTLSTFNRNFRRIMGISPQQWRKNPGNYEQTLLKYDIKTEEGW